MVCQWAIWWVVKALSRASRLMVMTAAGAGLHRARTRRLYDFRLTFSGTISMAWTDLAHVSRPGARFRLWPYLDGVARGFGGVLAAGRGGPPEGAVGELVDLPAGVLLQPVVMPTLRQMAALGDIVVTWKNSGDRVC
jgi:hypothetical protein